MGQQQTCTSASSACLISEADQEVPVALVEPAPIHSPRKTEARSLTGSEPAFDWKTFKDARIQADEETKIEFLTDVEGNWDYFLMFIDRSEVLFWSEEERGVWGPGVLQLRDNSVLIFGGDAVDKGPGDIRFVKTLLSLKHRYPSQVDIVIGNRDCNKLRLFSELSEGQDPKRFKVYWDLKAASYEKFMEGSIGKDLRDGPLATLHWMLNCNMGCQVTTFKTRKAELALINGRVTDEDVVSSYRQCANPNGDDPWMLDLLRLGKLATVVRDTLFVHADIPDSALGWVPGMGDSSEQLLRDSCKQWVDALNSWKDSQVDAYRTQPIWTARDPRPDDDPKFSCTVDGSWRIRGGAGLIDYGGPMGYGGRTVVYNNPFSNGNSKLVTPEVEELLEKWGIRRVLSGHQPHGQSPTVVRHPRTGLLRMTCDTSYSHMGGSKLFNKANNRGSAVTVTQMQGDLTRIYGDRLDSKHDTTLNVNPTEDKMPDALVGRQLKSEAWIKAVIEDVEVPPLPVTQLPSMKGKASVSTRHSHVLGHKASGGAVQGFLQVCLGVGFKIDLSVVGETQCCFMLKDEFRKSLGGNDSKFDIDYGSVEGAMLKEDDESNRMIESNFDHDEDLSTFVEESSEFLVGSSGPRVSERSRESESLTRCHSFLIEEFATYKTYIFAPQGTIYNIHDPDINRSEDQLRLLRENIVTKVNELMEKKRVLFVSNNSKESRRGIADKLKKEGIKFKEDPEKHIISASYTCAWFLKEAGKKRPFVLCSHAGLLDELRKIGITNYVATIKDDGKPKPEYLARLDNQDTIMKLVKQHPDVDCVVAGWDQQLSTLKIAVAGMYLRLNPSLKLVSCSMDAMGVFGSFEDTQVYAVGNGVIATAICNAIGEESSFAINVGKPSYIMLDQMRNSKDRGGFEVDLCTSVMVGDTLDTDMELARKGGMKSCLVFSGVTSQAEYLRMDPANVPPITFSCSTFANM